MTVMVIWSGSVPGPVPDLRCLLQRSEPSQGDAEVTPADAWSGEEYVRDESKGCDAALVKFLKRVQRCPDQCARYQ